MFLRHSSRHIHHTVAGHIEAGLTQLGWTDHTQTPFGAPALTFQRTPAVYGSKLAERIEAGYQDFADRWSPTRRSWVGPCIWWNCRCSSTS